MKYFIDVDENMGFEESERVKFIMHFLSINAHPSTLETHKGHFVHEDTEISFMEIWLPCAKLKQDEINKLKEMKND